MLDTSQTTKILLELMQGKPASILGPEADAFREGLKKDIELAKKNGWVIEIPGEWEIDAKGIIKEGSASSGNFGHAGRPGEVGGSAPGSGGGSVDAGGDRNRKKRWYADSSAVTFDLMKHASPEELGSLQDYANNEHQTINGMLRSQTRGRKETLYREGNDLIDNIDAVMKKSVLTKEVTVFRGIDAETAKLIGKHRGKPFIDRGFVSTTANISVLDKEDARPYDTILQIRIPKGTHAIWIGNRFGRREEELLLDRGLTFAGFEIMRVIKKGK